jgi:hypothetical protein
MKTKIYIIALILLIIIVLSAICASYKFTKEGMRITSDPLTADPNMISKVPLLPESIIADLLTNFYNIVKRNEYYLVFVYNSMYEQNLIDCSLNIADCSSIVVPYDSDEIIQDCCPGKLDPNLWKKVSPVSGETIQTNLENLFPFIMKHEQLLIIFNAQGLINYIPSNELYDTINGTNPGIEIMNSQLDYMKELKPTRGSEYEECDISKLQEDIDYLNNNLSSLDEDAQREIKRKIQDLTIRIIYLQSDNLKKGVDCNTNPTNEAPIITDEEVIRKKQMLTLYYLYHILASQNHAINSLEDSLKNELKTKLPFSESESEKIQNSINQLM